MHLLFFLTALAMDAPGISQQPVDRGGALEGPVPKYPGIVCLDLATRPGVDYEFDGVDGAFHGSGCRQKERIDGVNGWNGGSARAKGRTISVVIQRSGTPRFQVWVRERKAAMPFGEPFHGIITETDATEPDRPTENTRLDCYRFEAVAGDKVSANVSSLDGPLYVKFYGGGACDPASGLRQDSGDFPWDSTEGRKDDAAMAIVNIKTSGVYSLEVSSYRPSISYDAILRVTAATGERKGSAQLQPPSSVVIDLEAGLAARQRGDYPDAVRILTLWAPKRSIAGLTLGRMAEDGLGGPKDLAAARRWYERAVAAAHLQDDDGEAAAYALGRLYEEGRGGAVDTKAAMTAYAFAGRRGKNFDAQMRFARLSMQVNGAAASREALEAARAAGAAAASAALGDLWAEGRGVKVDHGKAAFYYAEAAAAGDEAALAKVKAYFDASLPGVDLLYGRALLAQGGVSRKVGEAALRKAAGAGSPYAAFELAASLAAAPQNSDDLVEAYTLYTRAALIEEQSALAYFFRSEVAKRLSQSELARARRAAGE